MAFLAFPMLKIQLHEVFGLKIFKINVLNAYSANMHSSIPCPQ